jgi:hypothetical protein
MNEEEIIYEEPTTADKIARNRYFEKQEKEAKRPLANEFALSDELLKNEPLPYFTDYEPPIDRDAIKANVNPDELSATRINGIQSSMLGFYGRLLNMDLTPTQLFHQHVISIVNNSSRGKNGWAGYLSKTSKSVSETTLVEKANQINNPEKKGFASKILGR